MTAQRSQADLSTENTFVAEKLRDVADLLEQQAAAHFRVRAYSEAASYIATLPHPIRVIYENEGRRGLEDLPTIGVSIAAAIAGGGKIAGFREDMKHLNQAFMDLTEGGVRSD